jgi:hypothetical protein
VPSWGKARIDRPPIATEIHRPMTDDSDSERSAPGITPRALAEKQARAAREAAALRENLRRRKQQARARDAAPDPPHAGPPKPAP